jgi:peptide chain release factor 3
VILGAVGALQFDVVAYRLRHEYGVDSTYDTIDVRLARWIECDDPVMLAQFRDKNAQRLALDSGGSLTYLAPSRVNLDLTADRWPQVRLRATREH